MQETRRSESIKVNGKEDFAASMKVAIEVEKKKLDQDVHALVMVVVTDKGVDVRSLGHPRAMIDALEGLRSVQKEIMKTLVREASSMLEERIENDN